MLNAEIIAIGSEMLTPFRVDTNSLWLTERLNSMGIDVKLKTVVGDDESRLEEMIRDAMKRSEIVISTGGLGPTEDDITRKIFARVLQRRLVLNDGILERIRSRFARRNMPMPAINERQALIIEGAKILDNSNGTAPGMMLTVGKNTIVMLPGPPRELKPMFDASVASALKANVGDVVIVRRKLSIFGLTESRTDELAAPIYAKYKNPSTTILFKEGLIELHLSAQARNDAEANRLLDELAGSLDEALGENVFSRRDESLEQVVGDLLKRNGYTLATAESCTGGLLAGKITDVAGSSEYFLEGAVTYSNESKIDLLGVSKQLIEKYGAVSEQVAAMMASGIRQRAGSTFGIGITGIAGPGGGTEAKPVGLVYIALADDTHSQAKKFIFPGDRSFIRSLSVYSALDMLRRRIK